MAQHAIYVRNEPTKMVMRQWIRNLHMWNGHISIVSEQRVHKFEIEMRHCGGVDVMADIPCARLQSMIWLALWEHSTDRSRNETMFQPPSHTFEYDAPHAVVCRTMDGMIDKITHFECIQFSNSILMCVCATENICFNQFVQSSWANVSVRKWVKPFLACPRLETTSIETENLCLPELCWTKTNGDDDNECANAQSNRRNVGYSSEVEPQWVQSFEICECTKLSLNVEGNGTSNGEITCDNIRKFKFNANKLTCVNSEHEVGQWDVI